MGEPDSEPQAGLTTSYCGGEELPDLLKAGTGELIEPAVARVVSMLGNSARWTRLKWPAMRVEASMWIVVVGETGGVKSGLGTAG